MFLIKITSQLFIILCITMLLDYISGLLAARSDALRHPHSKHAGLSSRKGLLGIYKKIGYILTISLLLCIDYLAMNFFHNLGLIFSTDVLITPIVTLWFIINETISIIENLGRMGIKLPKSLTKIISSIKDQINDS